MPNKIICNWLRQIAFLQAVLMGGLLGVGFLVPGLWFVSIFAIVWMIRAAQQNIPTKKLAVLFFLIWTIKACLSISWFWNTYPINWVPGLSESIQIVLIFMYWVSSSVWLGVGGALFALLALWMGRQSFIPKYWMYGLLPFAWLVSEVFAAFVFSFFTGGAGSSIQAYFSFGMIGYLAGVTPAGIWFAIFAGVYGLTVLMIGLGVVLLLLSKRVTPVVFAGSCLLLYLGFTFINPISSPTGSPERVVISVDTQLDAEFLSTDAGLESKTQIIASAVDVALKLQPGAIVLPEDSRYLSSQFDSKNPDQALSMFQFIHGNTKSVLIDSGRYITETGDTVLRANVFDGESKKMWQFDKQYLVPQGEYIPTAYGFVIRLLGYGPMLNRVARDSAYRPGPLLQTTDLPHYVPGVLFCFESVNPGGATGLNEGRPLPFIAHPISHAWFHAPYTLWEQLDVMLQVQARSSGVPIVSAGNMASGKLYLPTGEIKSGDIVGVGERYTLREFRF